MNRSTKAAHAATLENLSLPIEAPRAAWPMLIEHAAAALAGREVGDPETLARELRAIAKALHADRLPRTARALALDAGLQDIDRNDSRLLSLAALVRGGAA